MTTSVLTSLAILKVNWDNQSKDYVDNFVPFVVEAARLSNDSVLSLPDIQKSIQDEFGLNLPQTTLRMIIGRAIKSGFFRQRDGVFSKVDDAFEESKFRESRDKIASTHDRVLIGLKEYAHSVHGKEWSIDESEEELIKFLGDSSLSLLHAPAKDSNAEKASNGQQFIVGSFVDHVRATNNLLLDDLAVLAQGNLLANSMYLPEPRQVQKKFNRTTVYFDTSFLIYATGFAGPDRAAPCLELLNLLAESRAELKCFSDTQTEMQGILDACADRLKNNQSRDSYGPTIEYFIESGKTASDLELMIARLPEQLHSLGIKIGNRPDFDKYEFQIDESAFDNHLDQVIGYRNPKARRHDVDCISAIARIRAGKESRQVEECKAIFVTTNTSLAKATRYFFQPDSAPGTVALAVGSYALANLLWLKNPTIAPDLPKKLVIAHAYAATQPSSDLWQKYLNEIDRLSKNRKISAEDYFLLRHSLSAKAAMMELTEGGEEGFVEGSIAEILEISKEKIRADLDREVKIEKRRRLTTEEKLRENEEAIFAQKQKIRHLSNKVSKFLSTASCSLIALVLLYGIIRTFPSSVPMSLTRWEEYLTSISLTLLAIITFLDLVFGNTLKRISNWMEQKVSDKISSTIFTYIDINSTEKKE